MTTDNYSNPFSNSDDDNTAKSAIYIDVNSGTVPTAALLDAAAQLLRLAKNGQKVVIQIHSNRLVVIYTITRISYGNLKEEIEVQHYRKLDDSMPPETCYDPGN